MKTKEFVKRMNELNYVVVQGTMQTGVFDRPDHNTVALVSEKAQNRVNSVFASLSNTAFDVVISYAKTPIEDRKEPEKKYFVKVLPGEYGYLYLKRINSCEDSSKYYSTTAKLHNATNVKATFTKKEMADMRKEPGLAIDWDEVWLEPEV